jgi:hypothetical protein
MAKFPINPDDSASAIADALNYVLSGPGGLGQNFKGFSSIVNQMSDPPVNETAYLTGNFRPPFTQPTPAQTYVPRIALSTSEYLDPRTIKFTFAVAQATPPFALGNGPYTIGISPSTYDDTYSGAGVVECTTDYVIVRITGDGTTPAAGTGGEIGFDAFGGLAFVSTDCNAKVTVNGGTDRVFISAQLNSLLTYRATESSTLTYTVMINRRVAIPNNDPTNPEFVFAFDSTISTRNYYIQVDPTQGQVINFASYSGTKASTGLVVYPVTYRVFANAVTGSGTGLILDVTLKPTGITTYNSTNTDITVVYGGQGFVSGDTVKVVGTDLGASSPGNDLTLVIGLVSTDDKTLPPAPPPGYYLVNAQPFETIFTTVIDIPPIGYYWYLIELEVATTAGDAVITQAEFSNRSLSAQVVKQ